MKPCDAKTFGDLLKLRRDNIDGTDWWFMLGDGSVTFCQQGLGQAATGMVTIPRKEFDALLRWYTTGRWKP
jgi:hypothetical protein